MLFNIISSVACSLHFNCSSANGFVTKWYVTTFKCSFIHSFNNLLVELTFSYNSKDYFLIKEDKTFDEAVAVCHSPSTAGNDQRLVEITSSEENEFIYKTIVKPNNHGVWLGATNVIGTNEFEWSANGTDGDDTVSTLTNSAIYSNWQTGHPDKDVNQRNAVAMFWDDGGKWCDWHVSFARHALCQQIANVATNITQHSEYIELIMEVKQGYETIRDQLIKTTDELNSKLNGLLELNAINEPLIKTQQNTISSLEQSLDNIVC